MQVELGRLLVAAWISIPTDNDYGTKGRFVSARESNSRLHDWRGERGLFSKNICLRLIELHIWFGRQKNEQQPSQVPVGQWAVFWRGLQRRAHAHRLPAQL